MAYSVEYFRPVLGVTELPGEGEGFLLPVATWGAFPRHPAEDIQSGNGIVHDRNAHRTGWHLEPRTRNMPCGGMG